MKLSQLVEGREDVFTKYLNRLYEIAKDVMEPTSHLRDDIGDANIWPAGPSGTSKMFTVSFGVFHDMAGMDLSDLYVGNRALKRALKAKTKKSREANYKEVDKFRNELDAVIKRWIMYGLDTVEVCSGPKGPGKWEHRNSFKAEDFIASQHIIPEENGVLHHALYFRFFDDGSLAK